MRLTLTITALLILFSCNSKQEKSPTSSSPKIVKADGYKVPQEKLAEPEIIPAKETMIVRAGKPEVVLAGTNVHAAGKPKVVKVTTPGVSIPGQDSFSLPKIVPAVDRPFLARVPEVEMAKDAYTKEQNPHSFSSFSKLQGLKSVTITCLVEDRTGNLWIGTNWGVSKYDGKRLTHFTIKEGLCSNWVSSMREDKSGNIWFGTFDAGVSKYDGKRFTNFGVKEGLTHNNVRSILEDKNGNLWFGTWGGVTKYDHKDFTQFTVKQGLSSNLVLSMLEDKSGNIWFGTFNAGATRYDFKFFTHFTEKEGLGNNAVSSILEDKNGDIWFGTDAGATRYDYKTFTPFTEKEGLSSGAVRSMQEDNQGNLWFGTSGGITKYDHKTFTLFTRKEGLSDDEINCILKDKRGSLWFGTERGGVNKYGGKRFTHFTEEEGMSNSRVRSILQDKKGNLWFGTFGGGVNKYDGRTFTHFTEKEGMRINVVRSMLEDKSGNIWFSDWGGLSRFDGKNFVRFETAADMAAPILQDKDGHIWFGSYGGGVFKYDGKSFTHFTEKEGLSGGVISGILQAENGDLWFGTERGLSKYDGKNFTHFTEKEGLSDNNVYSIAKDKYGNIWAGTLAGGLNKYDGKNITHFTQNEGLANNSVTSIMEDKAGNLWFGTRGGLSKLEKNKLQPGSTHSASIFKTYTDEDGFSGISVNTGTTIYEANDGIIWIGALDRLTAFNPGEETPDTIPPNIQLTGLALYNENVTWQYLMAAQAEKKFDTAIVLGNGVRLHDFHFDSVSKWYGMPQHLSLSYNNNYLTFQFSGITINSPLKVKYQYKLEGLDKNWSALTNRTEASFGNLPHGQYTFKVKAVNGDGYWSNEVNYSFTIRPPWWHTWWAYALFAVVFAGIIYALFRYRLNKIRLQHKMVLQQHKAAELEMQALRAQMNPHFIFNCLSSINRYILKNESEIASEYITKFSRLIRLILQNSQAAFIPLDSELESLQLYMALEVLRFNNHFDYTISIADDLDTSEIRVPPLIIQPFVENAIWHGLMQAKKKGRLDIELFRHNGELCCKITDDGVGRKKAAELKTSATYKSMGLKITADRIAILNQHKQSEMIKITDLMLPDGTAGGTEVFFKIPLIQ